MLESDTAFATHDSHTGEARDPRKLLVVSDMHLGRDCNEITGFQRSARPNPEFDQAFIDLLDHYTQDNEVGWRVVFAGDFIDFIELAVIPEKQGPLDWQLTFEVTAEEKEFGLGTEAERVVVKLDRTLEYHSGFFKRVANFVRDGGEVVFLRGNHDVEFYWRKVQRFFRRRLASMALQGRKLDVDEAIDLHTDFQSRVSFAPWVYVEPGRVYIEHGHQYDVYCSFDNQMYPVSPTNPRQIDTPISAFAMRYFVNLLHDYAAHQADMWTVRDYVSWLQRNGFGGSFYILRMAIGTSARLLTYAFRYSFGRIRRYGQEHGKRLEEEASRFDVPVEKLSAVDALHHTPVNKNLAEVMRLLFIDRILLVLGAMALTLFILFFVENTWYELISIVLIGILALRINKRMAPRRFLAPGPKQAQAAKRIVDLLDVPTVVMGHSHVKKVVDLGDGRRYINTGSWLPPLSKDHVDEKEPCTCRLSHLVIEEDGLPHLRVFCKATKRVREADEYAEKIADMEPRAFMTDSA